MTLILSANTPDSLWMLADTRLSAPGRHPRDDGVKVMTLETTDGVALLGYAGLGATSIGTQPATWMSAVLRGRNMPMELSLRVLAEAMRRELPRHLRFLPRNVAASHNLVVQCFIDGRPKVYTIDLALSEGRTKLGFSHTRRVVGCVSDANERTPRIALAGSGAPLLAADRGWFRNILRLLRAYDRGAVSAVRVADSFAAISFSVHQALTDGSVGPRSVVIWRNRCGSSHKDGGAHRFYTGPTRERGGAPAVPTIGSGIDLHAITSLVMKDALAQLKEQPPGQLPSFDIERVLPEIEKLPHQPDENLR